MKDLIDRKWMAANMRNFMFHLLHSRLKEWIMYHRKRRKYDGEVRIRLDLHRRVDGCLLISLWVWIIRTDDNWTSSKELLPLETIQEYLLSEGNEGPT